MKPQRPIYSTLFFLLALTPTMSQADCSRTQANQWTSTVDAFKKNTKDLDGPSSNNSAQALWVGAASYVNYHLQPLNPLRSSVLAKLTTHDFLPPSKCGPQIHFTATITYNVVDGAGRKVGWFNKDCHFLCTIGQGATSDNCAATQ